jgi:glycerophosphoryl diester phosphodiesterase
MRILRPAKAAAACSAILITITLAGPGTEALAASPVCSVPAAVAHRGGSERYTENTRNAFRSAPAFWETDVRFTLDNIPVIMHDATVDRTTSGVGAVSGFTLAEWQDLRTADDQGVPTLRDFINDQSVDKAYAFVELKVTPNPAQWATFVAAIKSREGWGGPRPVISSFDPAVLDEVAVRLPGYSRALIQSVGDTVPGAVLPHASILLKHHDAITATRLTNWTSTGLRVYAWADPAADSVSEWHRMASYGTDGTPGKVDGMITSSPLAYQDEMAC